MSIKEIAVMLVALTLSVLLIWDALKTTQQEVDWELLVQADAYSSDNEEVVSDPEPEYFSTKIYAGGDIMLSRGIGYYNKANNRLTMFSAWAYNPINQFCTGDCLLIFNLESLFSRTPNDSPEPTFHFAANRNNIDVLHRMRLGQLLYLSLANNHTSNVGKSWIMYTRELLDQHSIYYGWAGEELESAWFNVTVVDRDMIRICISSYSYDGGKFWYGDNSYEIAKLEFWQIERDISFMKDVNCDVKIANLHRGREYIIEPTTAQRELAYRLVDNGIDLILGNHSHVPGIIEQYRWKYIVYSMGNHIFDQDRGYSSCDQSRFDTIYDYELERCTVPTYISMNIGITLRQEAAETIITLDKIIFSGMKKWILYPLDIETRAELLERIIRY